MGKRKDLHSILCNILGTTNVYYQPPESIKMVYPAIRYERNNIENRFADDIPYAQYNSYAITVIDENPDSEIVKEVSSLPRCRFNRHYTFDNLNHDVFTIYF